MQAALNKLLTEFPVRLNIDYDEKEYCDQFNVFLDGVKQTQCTIADSERGYVVRYKLNQLGFPIKSNIGKNRFKTEQIHGVVHFTRKECS